MNTAGKILQGAWDMTKQARSDLTKQARSNDNTYHADKSKGTGGNKRDSRSSQPSQGDILAIYEAVSQVYPDVRSQLLEPVRHDPVDVLVATILSQATNDTLSGRAFSELKSSFPDWESVLADDPCNVEAALACGGLQKQKTKKIRSALSKLKEDFGAITLEPLFDWPKERIMEYLTTLPGVGPKTAACVVVFGLGKPAFPVDTHILRIARRLGLAGEKQGAPSVQNMFEKLVPNEIKGPFHLMLIQHGREVCSARKPACPLCPLKHMCLYFKTNVHPDTLRESGEGTSPARDE